MRDVPIKDLVRQVQVPLVGDLLDVTPKDSFILFGHRSFLLPPLSPAGSGSTELYCGVKGSSAHEPNALFLPSRGDGGKNLLYASLTGPRSRRAGTSAQRGPSTFDGCRLQCMNVLQVAVGPSVVNPVSHHEHIGHLKSHVLHVQVDLRVKRHEEKSDLLQGSGIAGKQEATQVRNREPSVNNVVHYQNVPAP